MKQAKVECPHCGKGFIVREIDPKTAQEFNKMSGVFRDFSKLMDDFSKRVSEIFKNV